MQQKAKEKKKSVKFQVSAETGSQVFLAGSFNDWNPKKKVLKEKGDGLFTCTVLLPRGRYEYKFVVDDVWCLDPSCEDWAPNGMGSLNSVITVG